MLQRHDPQAIRWLFLQTGYRKVMNFTEDSIAAAAVGLERIKSAYRTLAQAPRAAGSARNPELDADMEKALDDDVNTAAALAVLYDFAGNASRFAANAASAGAAFEGLRYWLGVLGIAAGDSWLEEPKAELPGDFIERLSGELREARIGGALLTLDGVSNGDAIARVIDARTQARQAKDWAASDRLRDALARCGVELKDTKEGTTWTVVSSA